MNISGDRYDLHCIGSGEIGKYDFNFLELVRCRSREDTGSIGGSACCFEHAADAAACPPGRSARGPEYGRQRPRRTPPTVDGGCLEAL